MTRLANLAAAFSHLRLAQRRRLIDAIEHLLDHKTLRRANIMSLGEVSQPQASKDIQMIISIYPGLMRYDKTRKCYVLEDHS